MAMDRGGLTFHKEEAKTHNSCSMISKAPQILKWLLFCKSVSMIDRVVMYTQPCGAIQFVVLPPPRTPKRSGKTGDRSVSDELRRERMKLTVSRSSLYYQDWM